jgi:hypothetical protein
MPKIKNRIISIIVLMLTILSVVSLSACTKKLSKDEATSKVAELVEASYELNVIVFGEGLEYIETEESKNSRYALVKENEKYNSIKDIRDAIEKVFSEDYSRVMETTAFVGVQGAYGSASVPERYIENSQGFLVLKNDIVLDGNVDVNGDKQEIGYNGMKVLKYDPSTIEIVKISKRFIEANITSQNGEATILVTLILENGEWRLDSPTC